MRVPTALVVRALAGALGGCGPEQQGEIACSMDNTIAFEGREYLGTSPAQGFRGEKVRVGERLGFGEKATCSGDPLKVRVYRIRGVPVEQAVFAKPGDLYGVMERWNDDGTIK